MYTDSHCHLNALDLTACGRTLDQVVSSARECGVENILTVCTTLSDFPEIKKIAETYPNMWASAGVHPLELDSGVTKEMLVQLTQNEVVVALGETGLDYHYSAENKVEQQELFIQHLLAGAESALPVIVHTREAKKDTIALLREYSSADSAGVLHCFTEDVAMAQEALDLNFYISLSGIVTFKNAEQLRDVARYVPADRLLIETDSPYLAPVPYRGKSNEPKFVVEVGNFIAELRGVSSETLAQATTENFFRLFNKAEHI